MLYKHFEYGEQLLPYVKKAEEKLQEMRGTISEITELNQWRVLEAFRRHEVGDHHFTPSTGYGYDDFGRETLEKVYAHIFGTEAAIVRTQFVSGTHAIASCLFGLLRPGDHFLYITGKPYDTLDDIIGIREGESPVPGSLAEYNIAYQHVPLTGQGEVDTAAIERAMTAETKLIAIQRSKGYANRPSFSVAEIEQMMDHIRSIRPELIIFIDNCYGEFVETKEPTHLGADIMAGSLIKNPGGGLVKTGGYVVGKQELVKLVGTRLIAPGIGLEGGATLYSLQEMYQGLFMAPHVVGEALKGAIFCSALLAELGFQTNPSWNDSRTDLIQSIQFDSAERLITFCQGIQKAAPINAHVTPYPSEMPGYSDQVIMAAGTFIQGASIEFSADGPIRAPYLGFVQGGLTYEHVKVGIITALNELAKKNLLSF